MKWDSGNAGTKLSLEQMKVEVACLFYLQLSAEERSKGRDKKFQFVVSLSLSPSQIVDLLLFTRHQPVFSEEQ